MEALYSFGGINDDDIRVFRLVIGELTSPIVAVEFVEDAIERSLLNQRFDGVDFDQIDRTIPSEAKEGVSDEALLLLRC